MSKLRPTVKEEVTKKIDGIITQMLKLILQRHVYNKTFKLNTKMKTLNKKHENIFILLTDIFRVET